MGYLLWLMSSFSIVTILLWFFQFNLLWRYKKSISLTIFFAFIFSIPWDILAVKNNIWFFPKEGNMGIFIAGLPIKEYLFMFIVTLFISTLTILIKYRKQISI